MTSEQINIAITELCGWYEEDNESEICWTRRELTYCVHEDELPDYCNDLNAMHEAEKVLNDEQKESYFFNLMCLYGNWPKAIQATATERAEAFLKTIGKWEE